jgi:hypothetical protein
LFSAATSFSRLLLLLLGLAVGLEELLVAGGAANDGCLEDFIVDRPSSVADGALPGGLDIELAGFDPTVVG